MGEPESLWQMLISVMPPLIVGLIAQCTFFFTLIKKNKKTIWFVSWYIFQWITFRVIFRVVIGYEYGAATWFFVTNYWISILAIIMLCIILKYVFGSPFIKTIMAFLLSDVLGSLTAVFGVMVRDGLYSYIERTARNPYVLGALTAVFSGLASLIVLWLFTRRWLYRYRKLNIKSNNKPLWVCAVLFMFSAPISNLFGYIGSTAILINALLYPLLSCILFTFGFLWFGIQYKKEEEERRKAYAKIQQNLMEEHYHSLQRQIEMTRQFRDEILDYSQRLEHIAEQDDILTYTDTLRRQYQELETKVYCRNAILDTMIHNKVLKSQEQGIPVEIHMEEFQCGIIPEMDILSILCNIFDNAIEGCERLERKDDAYIWMKGKYVDGKLTLEMKNSINPSYIETGMKTVKQDKLTHGLGLKIVQAVVDKYHGSMKIETMEDTFFLQLMLSENVR